MKKLKMELFFYQHEISELIFKMSENNNIGLLKRLSELSDIERIILDEFREQIFDKVSKKKDREWLGK